MFMYGLLAAIGSVIIGTIGGAYFGAADIGLVAGICLGLCFAGLGAYSESRRYGL